MELCEENYFSSLNEQKYVGSSQIKSFMKCEAYTLAKINGEWKETPSKALIVGSYVDAAITGELDLFKEQNPDIFKKDGTLKSEFVQADYIVERVNKDELFKKYISGDHQTIMTGIIENVPVKIKIDSYFPGKAIVDLKCVKDFEPVWDNETKMKENFVDYWGYTIQAALYQEIVRQNTGERLPFFICAVTKEEEPDLVVMSIPDEVLDTKLELIKAVLPHIKMLKDGLIEPKRCGKCNYCKATKVLTEIIDYRDI